METHKILIRNPQKKTLSKRKNKINNRKTLDKIKLKLENYFIDICKDYFYIIN